MKLVLGVTVENYLSGKKKKPLGAFLVVQWVGLCAPSAGGAGAVPGWEARLSHAAHHG